jgi:hypothetical protein
MNNTFCKNCYRIPSQCCCTPAKTLTDEEIQELALCDEFWISEDCTIFDWHKFARAILRKAQEK